MNKTETYIVYMHTNMQNGKRYIGVTCLTPKARFKKGGLGYRGNKLMWADIEKFGWNAFSHRILAENLSADDAYTMEAELIVKHRANNPKYGYNVYAEGYKVPSGAGNAMSKTVYGKFQDEWVTYGSFREASRETGISLYKIRESVKTGRMVDGYVFKTW